MRIAASNGSLHPEGLKKMTFYVKQYDDGEVDISTPCELDEVELAIRLLERKQARKRIVDLAETLATSESE